MAGMAATPAPTVRPATPGDLDAVAALTAGHRARLAAASPRWWGQAPDADRLHRLWLGHLITAGGPRFRVVEARGAVRGCAVVVDQGPHWFLDDLAVGSDADWADAGAALLAAVVEAPVLTCAAPTDGPRAAALGRAGLALASCVWIADAAAADLPPGVGSLGPGAALPAPAPHTFGALDPGAPGALAFGDGEGGVVTGSPPVTAPPVYAADGTVCIVDRLAGPDPARLVRAAVAAAGTRGDALVAVVARAPDDEVAAVLDAAGFTPTVDIRRRG
jgi:hypothetical protein